MEKTVIVCDNCESYLGDSDGSTSDVGKTHKPGILRLTIGNLEVFDDNGDAMSIFGIHDSDIDEGVELDFCDESCMKVWLEHKMDELNVSKKNKKKRGGKK